MVYVDIGGGRRLGHVVKCNHHTVWVRVMRGAKTSITIKRHFKKHGVTCWDMYMERYLPC